jgi:hypothetical protein
MLSLNSERLDYYLRKSEHCIYNYSIFSFVEFVMLSIIKSKTVNFLVLMSLKIFLMVTLILIQLKVGGFL